MIRIFGGTWVYLAHESEIPNHNDFKTSNLGHRPIIILRDRQDKIRALFNRCTHRGATVCRETRGCAKTFTCPYHGWTYSNTGKLTGVPWAKGYAADFHRREFNLG
ncbi:MAG: aromatic ring-hydroxylating oxygenase subunit alpha, partial [Nostoc sp.]